MRAGERIRAQRQPAKRIVSAVLVHDDGAVRVVTLNRPERLNAIDMAMLDGLDAALAGAEADMGVRAILLRGAGRAFSAGDDLDEQQAIGAAGIAAIRRQVAVLQRISEHILFGTKTVVAAVHGWAVGGAFAWTLNCDFTLWAEGARAFLPEIPMGLFVSGGATILLPRCAGPRVAHEMIYRGRRLDAGELAAAGIAGRVVAGSDLEAEAMALARELAGLPRAAVSAAKRALIEPHRAALRLALEREAEACIAGAADPETLSRMKQILGRKT